MPLLHIRIQGVEARVAKVDLRQEQILVAIKKGEVVVTDKIDVVVSTFSVLPKLESHFLQINLLKQCYFGFWDVLKQWWFVDTFIFIIFWMCLTHQFLFFFSLLISFRFAHLFAYFASFLHFFLELILCITHVSMPAHYNFWMASIIRSNV